MSGDAMIRAYPRRRVRSSASCMSSSSVAVMSEPKITLNPRHYASRAVAPQQKLVIVPAMTTVEMSSDRKTNSSSVPWKPE
jgi:hypothetical protein